MIPQRKDQRQKLDHELLRKMWSDGCSVDEIVLRTGYKRLSVRTTLHNLGLTQRGKPRRQRMDQA